LIRALIFQLKDFLKRCRIATYGKKMKQLLSMIEENGRYIEAERAKVTTNLRNVAEIANWENRVRTNGTEIARFYAAWIETDEARRLKMLTRNEEEIDASVPRRPTKRELGERKDSEEESELEFRVKGSRIESGKESAKEPARKASVARRDKVKRRKAIRNAEDDLPKENTDIIVDINSDDWD